MSPTKGHQDVKGLEHLIQRKAERAGTLLPEEEKLQGSKKGEGKVHKCPIGGVKKIDPDLCQWYYVRIQEAIVTN